jgi:hypothetical protein
MSTYLPKYTDMYKCAPKKETPKDGLLFSTILRFMHNPTSNLIQR